MTGSLSDRQWDLLGEWLPGVEVLRDHSWGLTSTVVLEVASQGERFAVKGAAPEDHHLVRELRAHRAWLEPWTSRGLAPRLRFSDEDARLLVTDWLPGEVVEGSRAEEDPETYRLAGGLLALLHAQEAVADNDFEARETDRTLAWLDRPHRISRRVEARIRAEVAEWPTPPAVLVPTHGDWQPRNWVVRDDVVQAIDFGRADLRPAHTDWTRLVVQQLREAPELELAFLEGYGSDPREGDAWRRQLLREAVSTTVWAHQVRDVEFEAQGHRMLADALALDGSAPR